MVDTIAGIDDAIRRISTDLSNPVRTHDGSSKWLIYALQSLQSARDDVGKAIEHAKKAQEAA